MTGVSEYLPSVLGGTILMLICWFFGRFGYSIFWIVIFVILNTIKSKLWQQRQRRVIALQQAAMKEKEVILAQLRDLPAWVQFPDTERVEWMNKVIFQLWPYIGEYSKKFIKDIVEPQIKAHMPNMLKSFRFQEIDIGDIPLRVSGIKVYSENVGRDRIIMDMDVAYAGDCEFVVAVGAFKGGLRQVQFKGKLRAVLSPLIPKPPMIGGVTAFFLDVPTVDFDLTGLGEFVELPLLITTVRNVINTQIASICVLPNEIVIPLSTETDVINLYFQEPDGVVRIHCIEARNLENRDVFVQGKSDPFTRFSVGAQNFQTKTIDNTLNPVWDEIFEAVVDQASGQKLLVETFDDDIGKNDDFLGRTSIELGIVRDKGVVNEWYSLEGVKHGDLHLAVYWLNLSKDLSLMSERYEISKHSVNNALLMLYVDNASNLPSSKLDFEPSPYVEMTLGNYVQKTFPKPKTRNPLYRQKFVFFVSNVEHQTLKIEAKDEANVNKPLGEYVFPIRNLLKENNLESVQQTVYLALGPNSAPLVISLRLRFLEAVSARKTTHEFDDVGGSMVHKHIVNDHEIINCPPYDSTNGPRNNNLLLPNDSSGLDRSYLSTSPSVFTSNSGTGTLRLRKLKRNALLHSLYEGPLGSLEISMSYELGREKLIICVKNARNLKSIVKDASSCNPYVSIKLLNNGIVTSKRKTAIFKNTVSPSFGESFEFDLPSHDYQACMVVFDVKDALHSGWFKETPIIGEILFDLAKLDVNATLNTWFELNVPVGCQETN